MARTYGGATVSTGTAPTKTREQVVPLNLPATPPFYYMHHPARWMYVPQTGEVLPDLGKLKISPGIGGVDKSGSTTLARVSAEQKGWKVLAWDVLGDDYLREHVGKSGPVFLPRWVTPRQIGNRCDASPSPEALEGYYQFLRDLVEGGHVDPPDRAILEGMTDVQAQRHERILQRVGDTHPQKVAREQVRLDEMRENLEGLNIGPPAPKGRPYKGHAITGERGEYQADGKGSKYATLRDARAAIDKAGK
jgi:hypothetical protein